MGSPWPLEVLREISYSAEMSKSETDGVTGNAAAVGLVGSAQLYQQEQLDLLNLSPGAVVFTQMCLSWNCN